MIPKFSKLDMVKSDTGEDSIKFEGNVLKVIGYKDFEFVSEPHMVAILPYLRDEGFVLLRHEPIPTYQYHYKDSDNYKNITHFLTAITGTVEKGETLQNAVRRELYEEAGVVLSSMYQVDIDKSLFLSKGNCSQYHVCILEIRYNDFRLVQPKGDGSQNEKDSKTIRVSLGDLDNIKTHDLITDYLITKFKLQYNLK